MKQDLVAQLQQLHFKDSCSKTIYDGESNSRNCGGWYQGTLLDVLCCKQKNFFFLFLHRR